MDRFDRRPASPIIRDSKFSSTPGNTYQVGTAPPVYRPQAVANISAGTTNSLQPPIPVTQARSGARVQFVQRPSPVRIVQPNIAWSWPVSVPLVRSPRPAAAAQLRPQQPPRVPSPGVSRPARPMLSYSPPNTRFPGATPAMGPARAGVIMRAVHPSRTIQQSRSGFLPTAFQPPCSNVIQRVVRNNMNGNISIAMF